MSDDWERESYVECVVCPDCAFMFAAEHHDDGKPGVYTCPLCEVLALTEERDAARAEAEHAKFLMACADTPLMRDVMAERDAWRVRAESAEAALREIHAAVMRASSMAWHAHDEARAAASPEETK